MKKKIFVYILVVVISGILLWLWSGFASSGTEIFKHSVESARAKILTVDKQESTDTGSFVSTVVICSAEILNGDKKGEIVKVYQEHNSEVENIKIVTPGDKVVIKNYPVADLGTEWAVDNFLRTPALLILGFVFVFLIILLGRFKGLRTVISLVYTCVAIFCVFIPTVLSGKNIYFCAILICLFITAVTLLLVNGWDKKTFCAFLGCVGGVIAAALITVIFSYVMKFTGYTNENSYYLTMLPNPVNLKAIAFSAVIIGAVGAVMDVAMSLSSALYELKEKVPGITFKSLVSSGLSIGRDMMGTMANTLVLAYIGGSVSSVLLLLTYADSAADVFNREMIAYEILLASAGSIGIFLAIPVTALVCGMVYIKQSSINRG